MWSTSTRSGTIPRRLTAAWTPRSATAAGRSWLAVCSHLLAETPLPSSRPRSPPRRCGPCVPARPLPRLAAVPVHRAAEPGRSAEPSASRRPRRRRAGRPRPRRRGRLIVGSPSSWSSRRQPRRSRARQRAPPGALHALGPPRGEVSGGVAHTWSTPQLAGGHMRPGDHAPPERADRVPAAVASRSLTATCGGTCSPHRRGRASTTRPPTPSTTTGAPADRCAVRRSSIPRSRAAREMRASEPSEAQPSDQAAARFWRSAGPRPERAVIESSISATSRAIRWATSSSASL